MENCNNGILIDLTSTLNENIEYCIHYLRLSIQTYGMCTRHGGLVQLLVYFLFEWLRRVLVDTSIT